MVTETDVQEIVERFRDRADMIENSGFNHEEDIINQRNKWNVGVWRSVANEIEAELINNND